MKSGEGLKVWTAFVKAVASVSKVEPIFLSFLQS